MTTHIIYIDRRETDIIEQLIELDVTHIPCDIGRIHVGNWIFTRQTVDILAASIIDGSFITNREELRDIRRRAAHVEYIIEGQPNPTALNTGLVCALASLGMEFSVIISDSPQSTALQLCKIAKERPRPVCKVRPQIATPNELLRVVLEHVHRVGTTTAKLIATKYDSLYDFIQHDCNVQHISKKRAIPPKVQHNIRKLFGKP